MLDKKAISLLEADRRAARPSPPEHAQLILKLISKSHDINHSSKETWVNETRAPLLTTAGNIYTPWPLKDPGRAAAIRP